MARTEFAPTTATKVPIENLPVVRYNEIGINGEIGALVAMQGRTPEWLDLL